jgi:hypothetical protein
MWSVKTSPSLQVKRKAADFGKQGTEQTGDDFNPDASESRLQIGSLRPQSNKQGVGLSA